MQAEDVDRSAAHPVYESPSSYWRRGLGRTPISDSTTKITDNKTTSMDDAEIRSFSISKTVVDPDIFKPYETTRCELINDNDPKLASMTSNERGKYGEKLIYNILSNVLNNFHCVSSSRRCGDFHYEHEYGRVLIESKNYSSNMDRLQMLKFYDDARLCNATIAILISIQRTQNHMPGNMMFMELPNKNHEKFICMYMANASYMQLYVLGCVLEPLMNLIHYKFKRPLLEFMVDEAITNLAKYINENDTIFGTYEFIEQAIARIKAYRKEQPYSRLLSEYNNKKTNKSIQLNTMISVNDKMHGMFNNSELSTI